MGGKGYGGVKGKSGRRSLKDEQKYRNIIDKAWDLVGKELEKTGETRKVARLVLARDIVVKDITQHVKGEGLVGDINVYNILSQLQGKSKALDAAPLELDKADGLYKR